MKNHCLTAASTVVAIALLFGCKGTPTTSRTEAGSANGTIQPDSDLELSAKSGCPSGTPPAGGWPIVFTVNGNAYGPVQPDGLAAGLSLALIQRNVCSFAISHPALHSQKIFESTVIASMTSITNRLAQRGIVNRKRVGIAGFSGGGGVATIIAARYASTPDFEVKGAVSFYGPADINAYLEFHGQRSKGIIPSDPLFEGEKGPHDTCITSHGSEKCAAFSAADVALVSTNLGGPMRGVSDFLSARNATEKPAPIYACHGLHDDNVTVLTNHRIITQVWKNAAVNFQLMTYNGGHGANWTVCPTSLSWLLTQLTQ